MKLYKNINFIRDKNIVFEQNAVDQLNKFLTLNNTLGEMKNFHSKIVEVVITPDFHKGSNIPIGTVILTKGFVIPQAMGSDINCGMRLYVTDIDIELLKSKIHILESKIRHIFFEGGRAIPMDKIQREMMLKQGLLGILETYKRGKGKGIWNYYDPKQEEKELNQASGNGSLFFTDSIIGLDNYIGTEALTYDSQIGTIGGGNHFVEIQEVSDVFDRSIANHWGIERGKTVIMIHSGSLMIGKSCSIYILDMLKKSYPKNLRHPENGIYPLIQDGDTDCWKDFWTLMNNGTNFAFSNRLFLGLMMKRIFFETFGECKFDLLYDSPHNLIWRENINNQEMFLHRKGACSAKGMEQMVNTNFFYYGEPVFIPGSMGASSYILSGLGNRKSLFSASHGAGRKLSRGEAIKVDHKKFLEFIKNHKIITPVDTNNPKILSRKDILKKIEQTLKSEASYAYKEINDIIKIHVDNDMAKPIVKVEPILTIKN